MSSQNGSKNVVRFLIVLSLVLACGFVGFSVVADDESSEESRLTNLVENLHEHLMALHERGGGHGQGHLAGGHAMGMHHMLAGLDLDDAQRARLHRIHTTLLTGFHGEHADALAHIESLIPRIETGTLDVTETTIVLERHVDSLRAALGTVAVETVELINGLDESQRARLVAHLEALANRHR